MSSPAASSRRWCSSMRSRGCSRARWPKARPARDVLAELDGGVEYPHYTRPAEFRGWHRPRGAALRRPRPDRGVAARAEPGAEREVRDLYDVLGLTASRPTTSPRCVLPAAEFRRRRGRRANARMRELRGRTRCSPTRPATQLRRLVQAGRQLPAAAADDRSSSERRRPERGAPRAWNPVDRARRAACRAAGGSRSTGS